MTEITRKLASIRRVSKVEPIENADAIECLTIDGGCKRFGVVINE